MQGPIVFTLVTATLDDLVDQYYPMNPETETIINNGAHLRNGMVVLLEDSGMRQKLDEITDHNGVDNPCLLDRALKRNRWAKVTQLEYFELPHGDMISFVAEYEDGDKTVQKYGTSVAWLVKKNSIPPQVIYVEFPPGTEDLPEWVRNKFRRFVAGTERR